ncbi:MAG: WYL domain-containing protein [Flavobacteriales bacterium]|nr:WYL domain-containing protein [Flavobacteriales bacterium]
MTKHLTFIQESISNFEVLLLKYKSGSGIFSERDIEPLALYFCQNNWTLVAFCRLRNERREFLLNRIQSIEKKEVNFAPNQFNLTDHFL